MAATLTSSLVVRLIDGVTGPARKVSSALLGLNNAASGSFGTRLNSAIERNNAALDRQRGRLVDAAAGFYLLKNALSAPINAAVKFESSLADIAKVSSFDDAGIEAYGKRLRKLAVTEIPMAVDDLAALSAAAAQSGVPDTDLFDFTRMTAKAAVAWEISGAAAGEALAKIRTALRLTNDQTSAYADAINHVSDNTATSAPQLLDFTKRVAVQGEFFGYSKEQTLAFGAAMISAGAESEVAATSFRNMGRALTRGASATKAQRSAYKKLGLDAGKVAKAMQKDAVGTTIKVIEKLGSLPEHMQASVMSDLFGDEARALAPLLNDVEQLRKALALTADEQTYLNSVGREFEKRAATSEYKLQRFKSQLNDIALTIGASLLPGLNKLIGPLGEVAMKFSDWAEAHPELIANITAATAALVGFRIALIGLRFVGLLGKGGALSLLALGFNTVGKAAIAARTAIVGQAGLSGALATMSGQRYTGMQKLGDAAKALARASPGLRLVGPALTAIGVALGAISLPGVLAISAIGLAGYTIWKYWDQLSSIFSGVGRAIGEQLQPAIAALQPVLDLFKPVGDMLATGWNKFAEALDKVVGFFQSFGATLGREVLTEEQKAGFETAGYEMATRMIEAVKAKIGELVTWFASLPGKILDAIGSIDLSGIIKWPTPPSWWTNRPTWMGGTGGAPAAAPAAGDGSSGHRAKGGPVWPGGSFLVGENEPEVFTPKSGGRITPVSKLGGGLTWTGNLIVQGASDPAETARLAAQAVRRELEAMMRGAHADMGARP